MELPESQTTYGVRKYFMENNGGLRMGRVENPEWRELDHMNEEDEEWVSWREYAFNNDGKNVRPTEVFLPYMESKESEKQPWKQNSKISKLFKGLSPKGDVHLVKLKDTGEYLPTDPVELVKLCDRSKYGDLKTQTTVLDETVRKAFEIPGDKLVLTERCEKILKTIVLDDYLGDLYQFDGSIDFLWLKLNKLNVYTKGGHFQTHVDTPKTNMLGTLVLELPYDYEGGEFIINEKSMTEAKHGGLAFYSDMPHRIQEVKSGCRVSLTFYIMIDAKEYRKHYGKHNVNRIIKDKEYFEHEDLDEIVDALISKMKEEGELGLLLSHNYSSTEIDLDLPKGQDAALVNYLKRENMCNVSEVFPVATDVSEEWDYYCGDYNISETVYRFTEDDIIVTAAKMNNPNTHLEYKPLEGDGNLTFMNIGAISKLYEWGSSQDYIEHTGNESQPGYQNGKYFQSAVIISEKEGEEEEEMRKELCEWIAEYENQEAPLSEEEQEELKEYKDELESLNKDLKEIRAALNGDTDGGKETSEESDDEYREDLNEWKAMVKRVSKKEMDEIKKQEKTVKVAKPLPAPAPAPAPSTSSDYIAQKKKAFIKNGVQNE